MIKKSMTLVFVLLMLSPLFTATNQVTLPRTQNIDSEKMNAVSETDLGRVDWEANTALNPGFENWYSPSYPVDYSTSRTLEKHTWYETTIVNEGARSVGMETRNLDPEYQTPEIRLTQQSWIYWNNPINTTVELDWYIDEIANPNNEDYFRMQVQMNNRRLYYYFGCTTDLSNSTVYAYFHIDGPVQTWNHFARNVTSDYIEAFSVIPNQFQLIYWWVRSDNTEYTRVYLDDVKLYNGSYVHVGGSTLNGNFETTGGWTFDSNSDPAFVVQSPVAHTGDWSMNMTAISTDYSSRCSASYSPGKRLSEINKGQLSFNWRVEDYDNTGWGSIAEIRVNVLNATISLTMHYYLFIGGSGNYPLMIFGQDMRFKPSGFNVTDTWNFFNRNIWDDFDISGNTDELWVDHISIRVGSTEDDSRLSVLIDNLSFETALLNDMSYETQGAIGTPIEGWTEPTGSDTYTVTDFAYTGTKAGNMTVEDDQDFYYDQRFGDLEIDDTTELIFDFNVYLDAFNETAEDFLYFAFNFDDGEGIAYVIANATDTYENWLDEGTNIIFLQEPIVTGEWMNFQLDLVHDYESAVGSLPDTTVVEMYLVGLASKSSKLVAYFDDLYIYYDPAPEITDVSHAPVAPLDGGFALITATVVDATIDTVSLDYRVDNGSWSVLTMNRISSTSFQANLTDLIEGSVVEYSVTATDAFDKSVESLNGTEFYSFTVGSAPTSTPAITGDPGAIAAILIAVVILAVGVVILLYMFVIKKK